MATLSLRTTGQKYTSGESLVVGDVLAVDTAGDAVKADASYSGGQYLAIGASREAVGSAAVFTAGTAGFLAPVKFAAAPAGANNGDPVFLSTVAGEGTLTPPFGAGNVIYIVGVLQGADGATTTPDVHIRPQYITRTE